MSIVEVIAAVIAGALAAFAAGVLRRGAKAPAPTTVTTKDIDAKLLLAAETEADRLRQEVEVLKVDHQVALRALETAKAEKVAALSSDSVALEAALREYQGHDDAPVGAPPPDPSPGSGDKPSGG